MPSIGIRELPPDETLPDAAFVPDEEEDEGKTHIDPVTGQLVTMNEDGSATITEPDRSNKQVFEGWNENLADKLSDYELATISADLLQGIDADIASRRDWESTYNRAIDLLGLRIEDASGEVGGGGTISKVYHPLLLEAVVRYQANARAELLPANGPVKVRDDTPVGPDKPPMPPMMGHNGGPPMMPPQDGIAPPPPSGGIAPQGVPPMVGPPPVQGPPPIAPPPAPPSDPNVPGMTRDVLANAFESDFNHYLTVVAKEYYPDFDRMLFSQALGGCAFRKLFHCPLRRRPVSEFVPAPDMIVSNDATDLYSAGRVTHRVKMRHATMRRMMAAGVYRDIDLVQPTEVIDETERKVKQSEGIDPMPTLPADYRHTIYECYVELDLPGYENKDGILLPYRVTIDKDSREILEIRRNWKEGDEDFKTKRCFVKYGMIPGLGFYDYGYVHLLGNTARALTAIERQLLDAGQFANFPGFLLSKSGQRQVTNQIRVQPGGGHEIETNGQPIQAVAMPLPYKEPSAVLAGLAATIAQDARALAGSAELPVGEGTADIPVGTVIAMIEQSTKVVGAIHKRNHASQQDEFEIFRDLFKEDPTALWKFAKSPARKWQQEQEFEDIELVPASDPNTPSHVHRIMQATAIVTLSQQAPMVYDIRKVHERALRVIGIENPEDLFAPPAPPNAAPPPQIQEQILEGQNRQQEQSAEMQQVAVNHMAKMEEIAAQNAQKQQDNQLKAQTEAMKMVTAGAKQRQF